MNKLTLWLARDKDGELYLYFNRPERGETVWVAESGYMRIDDNLFPNLTWGDEPKEITIES